MEDEGALFSLDGFDDEDDVDGGKGGVAFPQSDDEETGTDGLTSFHTLTPSHSLALQIVPIETCHQYRQQ